MNINVKFHKNLMYSYRDIQQTRYNPYEPARPPLEAFYKGSFVVKLDFPMSALGS